MNITIEYLMKTESFRTLSPEAMKAFLLFTESARLYKVIRNFSIRSIHKLWLSKPELKMPKSKEKVRSLVEELINKELITYDKKKQRVASERS